MKLGAQRLSASPPEGTRPRPRTQRAPSVLNAFRHHRQRERRQEPEPTQEFRVLNAFRHHRQREHANDARRFIWRRLLCPVGATGRRTTALFLSSPSLDSSGSLSTAL